MKRNYININESTIKILLTIIFSFITIVSYSQADIGIGILSIDFNEETTIKFYKTSKLQEKIKNIEFFDDPKINSLSIKDLKEHQNWLKPETFWLDYYQFNFRVKSKKENCFEVYVSDHQTMWVEMEEFTNFLTWEDYLISMFSISRNSPHNQQIFEKPNSNSKEIPYSGEDCFNVRKMNVDWIEIFTPDHCREIIKIPLKTGWIKWKTGNKILINYHSTS